MPAVGCADLLGWFVLGFRPMGRVLIDDANWPHVQPEYDHNLLLGIAPEDHVTCVIRLIKLLRAAIILDEPSKFLPLEIVVLVKPLSQIIRKAHAPIPDARCDSSFGFPSGEELLCNRAVAPGIFLCHLGVLSQQPDGFLLGGKEGDNREVGFEALWLEEW